METGSQLLPKFDAAGLLTAVVTDASSKEVLMVAHMNAEALALTQETGIAHFWSRSRKTLWKKGETSGNVLNVREMRVDCDQDALVVIAQPAGPACHTGETSCFYRRIKGGALVRVIS
ncbi:MAG: phosphoribosyl-AMP cyclohydrolase [Erythrobacter sp.]